MGAGKDWELSMLKQDLKIMSEKIDPFLDHLISAAEEYIEAEGIRLEDTPGDQELVVMYAAYLYRKRTEESPAMPRMLRYALNNRLFSQKAKEVSN